ncbi:DUF488 domain-containing protein [Luteimonas sp. RD2P54]|uniref:DUF488 domain-containing protein n=1 Tax=Luteimonas endophytica TaxID=3042023 RepID=A0ABT6J8S5_9GAMM|nr:DUF488 domain-containing protein [Luteimonas endophytica]MDH5823227.1 DUF488 domain-containing protein [Luteimonas endophytica]
MTRRLWTVGHSTHDWDAFVALLREAGIAAVADVRRYPGSRRHPQYAAEAMAKALPRAGIAYESFTELGGRRPARPDSPNTGWRNASFRGYADYMATSGYAAGRTRLEALAAAAPTAVMCAEVLWWQCHRALVSDDFKARGWEVVHLQPGGRSQAHPWSGAARIVDGRLDYSAPADDQGSLF